MCNQKRNQRPELLLRELIPKYAHELDARGLDHRTHAHVRLLQLRQNLSREEFHDVDAVVHLTDPELSALGSDGDPQHQVDGDILHLPLVLVGRELPEHQGNVLGADGRGLGLELAAHGAQQFLRALAPGLCVGRLHVRQDKFGWIVLEPLLVDVAHGEIGDDDPAEYLAQRAFTLEERPMHQFADQAAQEANAYGGERVVFAMGGDGY